MERVTDQGEGFGKPNVPRANIVDPPPTLCLLLREGKS